MRRRSRVGALVAVATALTTTLAACAGGTGSGSGGTDTADGAGSGGTLTVLAASSLTESFDQLAKAFEKDHPGTDVRLTYDSSATLAQQVVEGAPADVLATADQRTMDTAVHGNAVTGKPRRFATNRLVLVVPADNPAHVAGVSDLDRSDVAFVMCDVAAPCGALGKQVLATDHVTARPKSLETDVKSVLTKVTLGEADAGLVYASDAAAAGDAVRTFPVPSTPGEVNSYFIAPVAQSGSPDLARAWVDLVTSGAGRSVLRAHGFGKP